MKLISFLLLLVLPASVFASASNSPQDLKRWRALLHIEDGLFGSESQADGAPFFLAANGKKDFIAEYQANVEAFQKDANYRCLFPARSKFIARELKVATPDFKHCQDYLDFKQRLSARSISLVFSSYYLNNPSSAFGHTLLRFKKEDDSKESEKYQLLDYAANFAANVTTSNALIYAVKGTFGGFKGEFAVMPYFYKIREYNDFESRDLWDYELKVSPDEVDWVISHLWEMKQTYFDYYYLSENCSYHILGLLNVANPDWKLLEKVSSYVPPVDTIKAITNTPGLLKNISFRPSKRRVLIASAQGLSPDERQAFERARKDKKIENLSANVLDTLIEYFDFENADAIVAEDKVVLEQRRELLIARAETGVSTAGAVVETPSSEAPHQGHETTRFSLGAGHSSVGKTVGTLGFRYALHDLLDPTRGQNPNAILEMGHFEAKYFSDLGGKSKIYLERADLIQVLSLSPFTTLIPKGSWRLRMGSERIADSSCDSCYAPTLDSAYGLSFGEGNYKFGFMLHTEVQAHKELSHEGVRLGAGPEAFFLMRPSESFTLKLAGEMNWWAWSHLDRSYEYGPEVAYHLTRNTSLRLKHVRLRGNYESLMSANFFF